MVRIDWRLALLSLITVPVGLFFFALMMRGSKESYENTVVKTKALNDTAVEYINGIEVIKAFGKSKTSYRDIDTGHMIENIVYFELLRRGYDVAVGKIGTKEIDFIATRDSEKIYYQVTEEMFAESTRERELAPLQVIRDNYEKAVIALNVNTTASVDGIKVIRLLDFLLE